MISADWMFREVEGCATLEDLRRRERKFVSGKNGLAGFCWAPQLAKSSAWLQSTNTGGRPRAPGAGLKVCESFAGKRRDGVGRPTEKGRAAYKGYRRGRVGLPGACGAAFGASDPYTWLLPPYTST